MGTGWEATIGVALSGRWDDPIVSLRTSGTGDKVKEGALGGDTGRGEPAEGDPPPAEGLPFASGETGEVVPLLACPLMLSLCTRETTLGWLVGVVEVVAAAPSLGLRLGLRLTALPGLGRASWSGCMVTTRPWVALKCSIRSQVMSLLGQYGQTT